MTYQKYDEENNNEYKYKFKMKDEKTEQDYNILFFDPTLFYLMLLIYSANSNLFKFN